MARSTRSSLLLLLGNLDQTMWRTALVTGIPQRCGPSLCAGTGVTNLAVGMESIPGLRSISSLIANSKLSSALALLTEVSPPDLRPVRKCIEGQCGEFIAEFLREKNHSIR